MVRWRQLKLIIQIPFFFLLLIISSLLFVFPKRVDKSSQVCAQVKKTRIHRNWYHRPPDLIHDALDHRTTVPCFLFDCRCIFSVNLFGQKSFFLNNCFLKFRGIHKQGIFASTIAGKNFSFNFSLFHLFQFCQWLLRTT